MTIVVLTSEEDPSLIVVRFIAQMSWAHADQEVAESHVNRLCAETEKCIIEGRWQDLSSLMLSSADLIFSRVSKKDLDCIFTIICNLVKKPESLNQVHEMTKLLVQSLNMLENPYSHFFVYMKAFNLAINRKVAEHFLPSFKKINSFLKKWNLGVKNQRGLFLKISNILNETKGSAKASFKFLIKYLETFSDEEASAMNEAKEETLHAIIAFVKTPYIFQCGLLDMPIIVQLEKHVKHALAYQLLKIFLTGRLYDYMNFQEANSELLKTYAGLLHEDCVEKMRLLTLVDLGMTETGQIPYSMIKDTLKIDDIEVESWVVKAISVKLLICKIDQINQVTTVSRCTERVFRTSQWQLLRAKLVTWRVNIAGVISITHANKIVEDNTQTIQGLTIH